MIKKQIKKELLKGRTVSLFLAIFIALASALCANAVDLIYSLNLTMNQFYETSKTSHMLQMHSGDMDEEAIKEYVTKNDAINSYEIVKMLNVMPNTLTIRQDGVTELGSVTDNAFVTQNTKFDFLLDSNNHVAQIEPGYIGVPVYYQMQYDLQKGDEIKIELNDKVYRYTIADFTKDSQMNSSYISSKRFLLNEKDWEELNEEIGILEYIIEFQLKDVNDAALIEVDYLKEGLPANGPLITYSAIKLLNVLTDVVTAVVLILAALFLVFISIMSIRFAMITSIDQEYIEIAVMKGIGLPAKYISNIYMIKYSLIALAGSIVGFVLSFGLVGVIQNNMSLYMGLADKTIINFMLQLLACIVIGLLVLIFCKRAVNKTRKVNVVEAFSQKSKMNTDKMIKRPGLKCKGKLSTNIVLGIKYMFSYKKPYIIVTGIFTILIMLALLPIQITTTIKSEDFSSYMGIAKCDIRIDFQDMNEFEEKAATIDEYLSKEDGIQKYGFYNTYLAYTKNAEDEDVYLNFETGNYEDFGISCLYGTLPKNTQEIAISYLLATEVEKEIGDKIVIDANDIYYEYTICGIYQDITNGGKSAKTYLMDIDAPVYRSVVNINTKDQVDREKEIETLGEGISAGRITDLKEYIAQTMSDSIEKFKLLSGITLIITVLITIFSISIFMKLLVIKYKGDIAIQKGLGFTSKDISTQYVVRMVIALLSGIILGEILVKTLGQSIVSSVMSSMGAASIVFVSNVILIYLLVPGLVLIVAVITTLEAGKMIKKICFLEE